MMNTSSKQSKQNFEQKNERIRQAFDQLKQQHPEKLNNRLNLSWSNWGFGMEPLETSAQRLHRANICYMELHGNHYGPDLGYKVKDVRRILDAYNIQAAGVCGMFTPDNDLSSNSAIRRQAAIDYIKRVISFTQEIGGSYMLVVPGAVGRANKQDHMEVERSVETLRLTADLFVEARVKAAIEPIRSAETSLVHTIAEAIAYIEAVDHAGVQHINGDIYHMQAEEGHIGTALLEAGDRLINLHMADSNRGALGDGSMDVDTIIMALYLLGFNREGCYVTPEPLGPGGDPYPAMYGKPDPAALDDLVLRTASYFREREAIILGDV